MVTGPTPGQAFHESLTTAQAGRFPGYDAVPWDDLDDTFRTDIEDATKAAIEAARLRQPEELRQAMAETRAFTGHLDLATRLMLDLGGDQLAASARRIRKAAGLES